MSLWRWLVTFLGFPLGGLLAFETIGPLDGPVSAAAGGLLAGAVIGAAQWLALRAHGIGGVWVVGTAVAMAAGTALAALATGAGTGVGDLMLTGLAAGASVGLAQAELLARRGSTRAWTWAAVTAAAWPLGWLATWSIGVDVARGYHVFGSAGAVLVTVVTGLVLSLVLPTARSEPAVRRAATV
jgi:hypothetical protein